MSLPPIYLLRILAQTSQSTFECIENLLIRRVEGIIVVLRLIILLLRSRNTECYFLSLVLVFNRRGTLIQVFSKTVSMGLALLFQVVGWQWFLRTGGVARLLPYTTIPSY